MKKTLTVLLALAMLSSAVMTSCSDATDNAETTAASSQTSSPDAASAEELEAEEPQDFYTMTGLPRDLNLNGYDIKFDVEEGNNGTLTARSVWVEEDSGDIVDAAVFERNMNVMEGLNCNITLLASDTYGSSANTKTRLRTQVQAGSDDVQLAGFYQYYGTVIATENLVYNMANFPYNDFTRDYWGVGYMDALSYKGAYFFATGPMALRYTGGVYVTYINSNLWNEFYADTNLYDVVRDGKWTYDYLYDVTNATYIDANGNGSADASDTYGFILSLQDMVDGMAVGADVKWSERDSEGNVSIIVNNERSISFYEKLYKLMYNSTGAHSATQDDSVTVMKMFNDGYGMATINKMFQAEIYLREMEDNYTILPLPKLDETQAEYNSAIHDGCTIFAIPITTGNPDAVSAVLEALAAESARLVSPAYYDQALKVKYTRDSDSGEMIDLIYSNISTDFAFMYSNNLTDIAHLFRNNISNKNEALASAMAKSEKAWGKMIERFLEKLDDVIESQG